MAEIATPFPETEGPLPRAAGAELPLQVGDWSFQPGLNRLSRGGERVRLEPKLADLLLLLVRRRGEVVSKNEIVDAVWEGRFIADSALTRAMAELRRALGDDAHQPIYIETISKRGYRLIAKAGGLDRGTDSDPTARRLQALVAALVLLALAGGLWVALRDDAPPPAGRAVSTLVVLPLEDLSPGGEAADYFAPAMTEALTTDLARVGAFRVISQRSLDEFAEAEGSLQGVARGVGADASVEGSIVRADGKVRINAQLTEAATDTVLWADSYERELVDILSLQSEVARAIVTALEASAAGGLAGEPAASAPKVDPRAHDLFLQAQEALKRCSWEGPNEAEELFERALEVDPGFARAHAGLASYYAALTLFDHMAPHDGFPKARAAAMRAIEIDPDLVDAQVALARVEFMFDWRWGQAEVRFQRAIELNPNHAEARHAYSFFLTCMGRFDEALEQARVELEIDPLSRRFHRPWVLFNARRYEESLTRLEATPRKRGAAPPIVAGWNYAQLGRYDEAIAVLEQVIERRGGDDAVNLGVLGWTLARAGRVDEARRMLARVEELHALEERGDLYPQVVVLAGLGETERALDLLEQAIVQRSPNVIFLGVEPFLDSLTESPRFQRLLGSVALPQPRQGGAAG